MATTVASRNGNSRPEPEVIVNFADGCAYSKGKMEEIFRSGFFDNKPNAKKDGAAGVKREDVDLIVKEFEIPRPLAEKALQQNGGDLTKTLLALTGVSA